MLSPNTEDNRYIKSLFALIHSLTTPFFGTEFVLECLHAVLLLRKTYFEVITCTSRCASSSVCWERLYKHFRNDRVEKTSRSSQQRRVIKPRFAARVVSFVATSDEKVFVSVVNGAA